MKIKDKIKSKVKAKVAKAKVKAKNKVVAKCGRCAKCVCAALVGAILLQGCATSDSAQPAKSQTQNNRFDDCIIIVATQCSISNRVIRADGTKETPTIDMFAQTQALETQGSSETYTPSATQTPTTDVRPDVDVDVPVTKGGAASDALGSLVGGAISGATQGGSSSTCPNVGGSCSDGSCELK